MTVVRFYNMKKRQQVDVGEADCKKAVFRRETANGVMERYAVRSTDDDGTALTKFINKSTFDQLRCEQS